jgi:hypothetical protein
MDDLIEGAVRKPDRRAVEDIDPCIQLHVDTVPTVTGVSPGAVAHTAVLAGRLAVRSPPTT